MALENDLIKLVESDEWMMEVLKQAQMLQLPDWWICAGFVRSKVWDVLHEFSERTPIDDVDVIYYDPSRIDEEYEKQLEKELNTVRPDIPWSVKNQARMHHINNLPPYDSASDGIAHFPETVTALGVSLTEEGKVLLAAPHGVEDVFSMQVRAIPFFRKEPKLQEVYRHRVKKKNWQLTWPRVEIVEI